MRVAAHLGVLDEIELIEPAITHLRRIGVDHVLACDVGSTDGTWEVLKGYESSSFQLLRMSNADSAEDYDAANLERVRQVPADWVLFLDADERWLPAGGSIRDGAALAEHDVVSVFRGNVPLGPQGPLLPVAPDPDRYDECLLFVEAIADLRQHMQIHPDAAWSHGVPMPRVMARRDCITGFAPGMHDVMTEHPVRRARASDVVVAHLPFTELARFQRKVENIREVHRHHPEYANGSLGWHWVRWVELANAGRLEEEFENQRVSDLQVAELRARGAVVSVAERFREARAS